MMKKFCEYCGDTVDESSQTSEKSKVASRKGSTSRGESERNVHSASSKDTELEKFLNHFASITDEDEDEEMENEDDEDMEKLGSEMEDEDEDEDEEIQPQASVKSAAYRARKLEAISNGLDQVSAQLEKSGQTKLAFQIDKIADFVDQYRQEQG